MMLSFSIKSKPCREQKKGSDLVLTEVTASGHATSYQGRDVKTGTR